jgi:ribosomal protein S18 acetylase RimI-like enzyme
VRQNGNAPGQPPAAQPAVREFGRADTASASEVLTRAFDDDPVMRWLFPDQATRRSRMPRMFDATLRATSWRVDGTVVAEADGQVQGCAIWLPPGRWLPPLMQRLTMLPRMVWTLRSRISVANVTYAALARQHPHPPHWYLSGIGTDPAVQGTGVGSRLMRSGLARCDAARLPAYLESSKESNVGFYERFGFTVTRELAIPGGGPTLWLMWRQPQVG